MLCSEYFFDVDREYFNSQEDIDEQNNYFSEEVVQVEPDHVIMDPYRVHLSQDESKPAGEPNELVQSYLNEGVLTIVCDEVLDCEVDKSSEVGGFKMSEFGNEDIMEIMLSDVSSKQNAKAEEFQVNYAKSESSGSQVHNDGLCFLKKSTKIDISEGLQEYEISTTNNYMREVKHA